MSVKIGFKAIVPKRPLITGNINTIIRNAVDKARVPIEKDLNAVTATWEHKVRFKTRWNKNGKDISLAIYTNDKVFIYVNNGTRPHIIRPRRASRLAFLNGYKAKTVPGRLSSSGGGKSGLMTFRSSVNHPGNEARKFDEAVMVKHRDVLKKELSAAIKKAASGR